MTTDSVFILFKKTDFNTILACLGVRCIGDRGHNIFVAKIGGSPFYRHRLFVNLGPPFQRKCQPPKLIDQTVQNTVTQELFGLLNTNVMF